MSNMPGSPVASVTVQQAAEQHGDDDGALIIDVREPSEFAQGRVDGAILLPLGQLDARYTELPRDRVLLMMCRSGGRSSNATQFLTSAGYDKAVNVDGGMVAWHNAGLPMKSGTPEAGEGEL